MREEKNAKIREVALTTPMIEKKKSFRKIIQVTKNDTAKLKEEKMAVFITRKG